MDWEQPPAGFRYVLLESINPAKNRHRWYYLAWQPTLFHAGAVVRLYGRIGGQQRSMAPVPFDSLTRAWPMIRALLKRRLRHGYEVVAPDSYV